MLFAKLGVSSRLWESASDWFAALACSKVMPFFSKKGQELIGCGSADAIAVFTVRTVDGFDAEFPFDPNLCAAACRDEVRDRDHLAKVRLPDLGDIMLDDKRISDGFDVDRHRTAIVSCGRSGSDVCGRAPLILRVWKVKEPIRDIDFSIGAWIMAVTVERTSV
jgi:hypothetical protein